MLPKSFSSFSGSKMDATSSSGGGGGEEEEEEKRSDGKSSPSSSSGISTRTLDTKMEHFSLKEEDEEEKKMEDNFEEGDT